MAQALADSYRTALRSIVALGDAASSLSILPGPATQRAVLDTERQLRAIDDEFGLLEAGEIGLRAGSGRHRRGPGPRRNAVVAS